MHANTEAACVLAYLRRVTFECDDVITVMLVFRCLDLRHVFCTPDPGTKAIVELSNVVPVRDPLVGGAVPTEVIFAKRCCAKVASNQPAVRAGNGGEGVVGASKACVERVCGGRRKRTNE